MTDNRTVVGDRVSHTLSAAVERLFSVRRPDGSWQDTLPSGAVVTASSIVALHFADPDGSADLIQAGAAWLRETQGEDGGWGDEPSSPSTLNVTPFAVGALALVAPGESAEHIRSGLERIERFGGMAAVSDREKCKLFVLCELYLALGGLYDENRIRRMPVEIILLPLRLRQKVSFIIPHLLAWGVMQARTRRFGPLRRLINRIAEPRVLTYLEEIQEFEGPDGGYQESPFMVSIVCLGLARAGLRPDIVQRCVRYLRTTVRPEGAWAVNRDLDFSATSWVTLGLQEAGYAGDPRMADTLSWILAAQRREAFPPTGCPAGGWGWSMPSGWPDSDDTADALIALAGFGLDHASAPVRTGVEWLRAMQNRNGSWSCFCPNNHIGLDAPCSAMTAHAVTALQLGGGLTAADPSIAKAVGWFGRVQRDDGAIPCLWYRGLTSGTGSALETLGRLGLAHTPTARRCSDWLVANQLDDGGWGDGQGAQSSVEETSWALLGLLHGEPPADDGVIRAGIDWLIDHQRPDGLWTPSIVGYYFLDLMYSNDLLATGYALQALGRYQKLTGHAE